MKVNDQLMPVLQKLQKERFEVFGYLSSSQTEINSLYWFERGRVLNIQPSIWRSKNNLDCYHLSVSYIPSYDWGSGCRLSESDWGLSAIDLLDYRNKPTITHLVKHYKDMDYFIRKQNGIFVWYKINQLGEFETDFIGSK